MKKFRLKVNAWITVIKEDVQAEIKAISTSVTGEELKAQIDTIVATAKADALTDLKAEAPAIFSAAEKVLAEIILNLESLL